MIKFERTDDRAHVEAGGELVEILADITILLKVLYEHMEGEQKEEFRFVMSHALAEDDFPAWDGKPLPGQTKTEIAPGVEELVQRLGSLEHLGPDMLGDICDHCCKYPEQYGLEDERRLEICDKCPMNHLLRMMGME